MELSIVVPVFNSEPFLHVLLEAVEKERINQTWQLELILVDDGSRDQSYRVITELASKYPYIKAIQLSRNFGHQAAVRTGLAYVSHDLVAILDDDLQDPPSLLPQFLAQLQQGYDVVYGIRKKRKEKWAKRLAYILFYRLLMRLSDTLIPLDSGDFCVMKKRVVENMLALQEQRPFLRGIRAWVGFRQLGLEYERQERIQGESGYTFSKLLGVAMDGIFAFSSFPIRFISFLGLSGLALGLIYTVYILWEYAVHNISIKGYTSIVLLIVFFGSLNLISVGMAGEYIYRIFLETRHRPHAIIAAKLNISE